MLRLLFWELTLNRMPIRVGVRGVEGGGRLGVGTEQQLDFFSLLARPGRRCSPYHLPYFASAPIK